MVAILDSPAATRTTRRAPAARPTASPTSPTTRSAASTPRCSPSSPSEIGDALPGQRAADRVGPPGRCRRQRAANASTSGKYVDMVERPGGGRPNIKATPTIRINGEEYESAPRRPRTWSPRSRRSSATCRAWMRRAGRPRLRTAPPWRRDRRPPTPGRARRRPASAAPDGVAVRTRQRAVGADRRRRRAGRRADADDREDRDADQPGLRADRAASTRCCRAAR